MAGSIVVVPGYIFAQILVEEECRRVGAAPGLSPGEPLAFPLSGKPVVACTARNHDIRVSSRLPYRYPGVDSATVDL